MVSEDLNLLNPRETIIFVSTIAKKKKTKKKKTCFHVLGSNIIYCWNKIVIISKTVIQFQSIIWTIDIFIFVVHIIF